MLEESVLEVEDNAALGNVMDELARLQRAPDPAQIPLQSRGTSLDNLKQRHSFLNAYTAETLAAFPLETLLKLEATSIKLKNLEHNKAAEVKLAANRDNLAVTIYKVQGGEDNRWSSLHEARFLPGWGCSAQKMWGRAREVLMNAGQAAIGTYDMASVGLAGHVTSQGWAALHDPGSSSLALRMFSINNCGRRLAYKQGDNEVDNLADILELGELKTAMRVLKEAVNFVRPWDKSVAALDGFLYQTDYCKVDLDGLERKAEILTQFIDYVLKENSNRWKGQEPFLGIPEMKGTWESFFGSRPQSQLVKAKQPVFFQQQKQGRPQGPAQGQGPSGAQNQQACSNQGQHQGQGQLNSGRGGRVPSAFWSEDICVMFNLGKCIKPAGTCITKMGKPLRHVCNWRPYNDINLAPCGAHHAAANFH